MQEVAQDSDMTAITEQQCVCVCGRKKDKEHLSKCVDLNICMLQCVYVRRQCVRVRVIEVRACVRVHVCACEGACVRVCEVCV